MPGIFGFDPPEPDLPSGAGTTLALPQTTLPVGGGEAPSESFDPAAIRDPSARLPTDDTGFLGLRPETWRKVELFSAGVQDAVDALQGKSGTALRDVLTRRSGTAREERKAKVEEERLGVERGRFTLEQIREARAIQTQQNQTFDATVKLASEQAPKIMAIGDDKTREATITGIVEEARERGGNRVATVVQGLLRMPQVGQMLAPLMRDLRGEDAASLRQIAVVAASKGELDAGLQRAQSMALPITNAKLLNQMRVVSGVLRATYEGKGQKIPLAVLEAAIQASNPEDAPGTNPQLNLLRGLGEVYSKAQERVRGNLGDLGFELPGVAAEVAKKEALIPVEVKGKVAETTALLAPEIVTATAAKEAAVKLAVKTAEQTFAATAPLTPGEAGAIRGQFLTQAKDFSDTLRAYQRIEDAVKDPSAAGDIAVLFGYMKMLDPGSVVRESEFATAANAAGVPEQIRNAWNRLMTGQRLGEAGAPTREDIADRGRRLVSGQLDLHEQSERAFRAIGKKRKGDPEEIVPDIVGADLRTRIKEGGRKAPAKTDVIEFVRDPKTGRLVPRKK